MRRLFFLGFWLVCALGLGSVLKAQKTAPANFQEGKIIYDIKVTGAPQMESLLQNSSLTVYFQGQSSKMDLKLMNGLMRMQFLYPSQEKIGIMLLDMPFMGEKSAVTLDSSGFFSQLEQQQQTLRNQAPQAPEAGFKLKRQKRGSKTIAKHKCNKNVLEGRMGPLDSESFDLYVYLSDKLRPDYREDLGEFMANNMAGFPLGFELKMEGMKIEILAKSIVRSSLSKTEFEVPGDYTPKTLQELQEGMGGLLGGEEKQKSIGL